MGEVPVGLLPTNLYTINIVGALIFMPLAAVVGAWPYQEA